MEYPKTENLFRRDDETHLMLPGNGFRMEEIDLISKWLVLEKIDGMNMRVVLTGDRLGPDVEAINGYEYPSVNIYGRSDRAQIPGDLMARMVELFPLEKLVECFGAETVPDVVLFGEGYGPGIQQGGHYGDIKDFMLFDVVINGKWQPWSTVELVAKQLGCKTVPVLARAVDLDFVHWMVERLSVDSAFGVTTKEFAEKFGCVTDTPEGVIARTDPYLFDGRGRRIMFKHKVRDVVKMLENDDALVRSA